MKKIPVIVGPTSSGKTSLTLSLCKELNSREFKSQILSFDSRQIYKYMDIGTGKRPLNVDMLTIVSEKNKWVFDGIDVFGYDLVTPTETYSAYDYANFALSILKEGIQNEITTFMVGGTGFYADIVTARISPSNVKPNDSLRKSLEIESLENLQKNLMSLNPQVYEKTDVKNKLRLIRAIERESSKFELATPLPYINDVTYLYFGLTAPREVLYENADRWLESVWHGGLIDEVKSLVNLGFDKSPKLHGLVYKSVLAYLEGTLTETAAIERAKFDLHAYIRRQLTWFKKNENIKWFDVSKVTFDDIKNEIFTTIGL